MKYIKKPLIVEAFRYGHDPYPAWYAEALYNKKVIKGEIYPCKEDIFNETYEVLK